MPSSCSTTSSVTRLRWRCCPWPTSSTTRKDDVVIVAVGGRDGRYPVVLRHIVEHPQRIAADTYGEGRLALDIVDGDGDHTIVTIQAPT